jgi:hypothetical protein
MVFAFARRTVVQRIPKLEVFVMSRSPSSSLPLRAAITGFLNYGTAPGLSQRSVDSYKRIPEQWAEYVPRGFGGDMRALSPKSLRNIWISLCAFFTWVNDEFRMENPMKSVSALKSRKEDVERFTQEEITCMLRVSRIPGRQKHSFPADSRRIAQQPTVTRPSF